MDKKYSIGLDVGITGVGWCVTDDYGRIIRNGKHHLWGTVKFDEAETAAGRREKRTRRRRMNRRKTRLKILQALLEPDVAKVDPYFCDRLAESPLRPDDRTMENIYKNLPEYLFTDGTVAVRENTRHMPIYMIRDAMVKTDKQADIRYVYLAIHHILKSRGHFLDETAAIRTQEDAEYALQGVLQYLRDELGAALVITPEIVRGLLAGMQDGTLTPDAACDMLQAGTRAGKAVRAILLLMSGKEANAKDLFAFLPKACRISFEKLDSTEAYDSMSDAETDQVLALYAVYSWINRREAQFENKNISEKMTELYRRHQEDLRLLKAWFRQYKSPEDYRDMFHNDEERVSYNAYTASRTKPAEYTGASWNRCSQEVFYSRLEGIIRSSDDPEAIREGQIILNKMYDADGNFIPNGFLPLQHIRYNQRTPNREHLSELKKILAYQAKYYHCIRENQDKILALCGFYIPYYVGPLVQKAGISPFRPWIAYTPLEGVPDDLKEFLKNNPVRPWNFQERIDLQATAENYTTALINRCTFMPQEKVLPKHSLLYEEFQLLEAVNQLRIRYKVPLHARGEESSEQQQMELTTAGEPGKTALEMELEKQMADVIPANTTTEDMRYKKEYIPAAIRREIIDKFFYTKKRVRVEEIVKWMLDNYPEYRKYDDFCLAHNTGKMQGYFKVSLQATHDMLRIFAPENPPAGVRRIDFVRKRAEALEKVILWSTVYKDRKIYKNRLWAELRDEFTDDELRQLERLRYDGWGRFCRRLLEDELCDYQGKKRSVIQIMRKNSLCFMQIYHRKDFGNLKNNIPKENMADFQSGITYDMICERLHCSPALRRGLWTAVRVIQEIEEFMASKPDKYTLTAVYIRNQRESNAGRAVEKQNPHARYDQVRKLYNNYEKLTGMGIDPTLRAELETYRTEMSDTEYLYFTQLGRCMYTGRKIDLKNTSSYIVDYIVPLGLLADTTLDNRILILQDYNTRKYNQPMPQDIVEKMNAFWDILYTHGFISYAKYGSLIKTEYTEQDLHYYLRSQWTGTGLIMENLTRMLKEYYNNRMTGGSVVVYGINAKLVNQFRNAGNNYYIKNLNDAQQMYDAFLTAHIGAFAQKYFSADLTNEEGIFRRELARLERLGYQDKNGILVTMYNSNQPNEENYNPAVDKGLIDTLPAKSKYTSRLMREWIVDHEDDDAAGKSPEEPSPWTGAQARWAYQKQVYGWHDGYVNYILKENQGQFYHERVYRPGVNVRIPVKENLDPQKYGGHINAKTAYMAVIAYEEGRKEEKTTYKEIVNIPVYIAAKTRKNPDILLRYIREGLGFNEQSGQHNVRIVRNKVMLHQEIILDGHPYYLMSASELITAKQLYIRPEFIQTVWTATTMPLDQETVNEYVAREYIDVDMVDHTLEHLLDKLLYQYRIYPLLCRQVEESLDALKKISPLGKLKLIAAMVNAMNTQSIRIKSTLAEIVEEENKADPGLSLSLAGDNRLNNRRIRTDGDLVLVNRSVTGIRKNETRL